MSEATISLGAWPRFSTGELREHLRTMKSGLRMMGGDLVWGDGSPLEYSEIEPLISHIHYNLPSDKRIFGFTIEDVAETLKRVPFKKGG